MKMNGQQIRQKAADERRLLKSPSKEAAYDFGRIFLKTAGIDAVLIPSGGITIKAEVGEFSVRFKTTPLRIDDFIFSFQS